MRKNMTGWEKPEDWEMPGGWEKPEDWEKPDFDEDGSPINRRACMRMCRNMTGWEKPDDWEKPEGWEKPVFGEFGRPFMGKPSLDEPEVGEPGEEVIPSPPASVEDNGV